MKVIRRDEPIRTLFDEKEIDTLDGPPLDASGRILAVGILHEHAAQRAAARGAQ